MSRQRQIAHDRAEGVGSRTHMATRYMATRYMATRYMATRLMTTRHSFRQYVPAVMTVSS
jgi:hypothetical protein